MVKNVNDIQKKFFETEKVNIEKAQEKNLIINDDCSLYSSIQKLYLKGLEKIISDKIDLKIYDDMFNNLQCEIKPITSDKKTYYHKLSDLKLNFIFIRNNMYVEKLSNEVLDYFKNKINNNDFNIDDMTLNIINNTYKDVISKNYFNGKYFDNVNCLYDADSGSSENYSAKSNDLVFVIQIGDYETNLDKADYIEYLKNRVNALNGIKENLYMKLSSTLNVGIKIFIRTCYCS